MADATEDLRFNEAGAVMPRKDDVDYQSLVDLLASMRPGLLCPGSCHTSFTGTVRSPLQ